MENCQESKNKILKLLRNPCVTSRIKKLINQTYTVKQSEVTNILLSANKTENENSSGFSSTHEDVEQVREQCQEHHLNIIHKQSIFTLYESKHSNSKIAKIVSLDESQNEAQGMTFHVDFASTPKKTLPRCSTPKTSNLTKHFFKDLTNPVEKKRKISKTENEICTKKRSTKAERKCKKQKKEKKCVKCCQKNKIIINSNHLIQMPITQPQLLISSLPQNAYAASWNKLKYPIRFYPNIRSQDIDRVQNVAENMYDGFNMIPNRIGYDCGDYKVWVL